MIKNKNGSALLFVIIAFAVIIIIGTTLINVQMGEAKTTIRHQDKTEAYYSVRSIVEGVADIYLGHEPTNEDFIQKIQPSSAVDINMISDVSVGNGTGNALISRLSGDRIQISAEATANGVTETASVILEFEELTPEYIFRYALFSVNDLDVSGADCVVDGLIGSRGSVAVSNGANVTEFKGTDEDGNPYSYTNEEYVMDHFVNENDTQVVEEIEDVPAFATHHGSINTNTNVTVIEEGGNYPPPVLAALGADSPDIFDEGEFDLFDVNADIYFIIPYDTKKLELVVDDFVSKGDIRFIIEEADGTLTLVDDPDNTLFHDYSVFVYVRNNANVQTPGVYMTNPVSMFNLYILRDSDNPTDYALELTANATFMGIIYAPDAAVQINTKVGGGGGDGFIGSIYAEDINVKSQSTITYRAPENDEDPNDTDTLLYTVVQWGD